MAQKRYGPVRGAGVGVIEQEGQKPIEQAAFGWAGYAGILEKGPVGELIEAQSRATFEKICGGIIEDSVLPDCCFDYYNNARGAGGLLLRRVTDGNEVQATATLYARKGDLLTPMGTLKAHNGGRWGGKDAKFLFTASSKTDTTITTGVATWTTDQWKGAFLSNPDIPNKVYEVVGNTSAGVLTLAADSLYLTDWNAEVAPNEDGYLYMANDGKAVSYLLQDGEENPDTEFALSIFVDGAFVKKYPDLSTDPTSSRYWVNLINNDTSNYEVVAADTWTGAHVADVRPANHYGAVDSVTDTILTAIIHDFTINSPVAGGDPTIALGVTTDAMVAQKITITMTAAAVGDAVSDVFGDIGEVTFATPFNPPGGLGGATPVNKWIPPFTITAGVTPLNITDVLVINYKPFVADALIGGRLYPDKVNAKRTYFNISDNTHDTITAPDGSTMTDVCAPADYFLVETAQEMSAGVDGNSDLVDGDYISQGWDVNSSVFNRIVNRNFGVIKFATPGISSTGVQKAGVAYADAKNMQYRYQAASTVVTEIAAIALVNDTLGRSDYAVMAFPSYAYVIDLEATEDGKLKLLPLTGQIHGREAAIAKSYDGYHKAQAGTEAVLPAVIKIPTGEAILDEESLNPVGIQVIKKIRGNFVIWGDRTLSTNPTWKWKHQRELMSHYENVLRENFDWIVFAINDPDEQTNAISSLVQYFLPEWRPKRAIRGDTFKQAAIIKVDSENNTDSTRAGGDMFAEISLKLADTVERFIIKIGKQGIFDSVA